MVWVRVVVIVITTYILMIINVKQLQFMIILDGVGATGGGDSDDNPDCGTRQD